MKKIRSLVRLITASAIVMVTLMSCEINNNKSLTRILILSGRNNHEWNKTTPALERIFRDARIFTVDVTEQPDTLNIRCLKKYDVIISNWNTWPDNNLRLNPEWEAAFLRYVSEGGGAVFIHAGASSFYTWPEYHRIGIGRWGRETSHGQPQTGRITSLDQTNLITGGIRDFVIFDELWKNADIDPEAKALGSVTWKDESDGKTYSEDAIFINKTGKGRSFYTILGHDERALLNTGLRTLILRGTLWAAGKENFPELPAELAIVDRKSDPLAWEKTDSSACLKKGNTIIWQFNFNNRYGRPYFHPVTASDDVLTCVDPPDHPWHLGLWFCWKYINEVNYWEYLDDFKTASTGYKSAGITEITDYNIIQNIDFSADISMNISYHPDGGAVVLTEESDISVSPPDSTGSFCIDYENRCTAVAEEVILDRTPVQTEPGGRTWGGYAGLSVRFSQDLNSPFLLAASDTVNYKKNAWVYMGFNTLTGSKSGICIIQDPVKTTPTTSWYIIRTPGIPFFYYSPAVIYDGKIILKKGEQLNLKYRVWVIPGKTSWEDLDLKYKEYLHKI